jgi:hypothetical protein
MWIEVYWVRWRKFGCRLIGYDDVLKSPTLQKRATCYCKMLAPIYTPETHKNLISQYNVVLFMF